RMANNVELWHNRVCRRCPSCAIGVFGGLRKVASADLRIASNATSNAKSPFRTCFCPMQLVECLLRLIRVDGELARFGSVAESLRPFESGGVLLARSEQTRPTDALSWNTRAGGHESHAYCPPHAVLRP